MYEILSNTFQSTLNREGKDIEINGTKHKVFFRRNDGNGSNSTDAYTTLFAPLDTQIKQGELFSVNGDKYLVLVDLTAENDVYKKYKAIRTNAEIKWMFGKNDLVIFDVFMDDVANSLHSNKNGVTLSSKVSFMISLDENSKKIKVNGRFFCGSYHAVWKISDLNYLNDMVYISVERDAILPNDDAKNGIVGRYDYDPRPSTYRVEFDNVESITIKELESKTVKYSIFKDGVLMDNPPIKQTFIVDNNSYISADDIDTTGIETVTDEYLKININNDNIAVNIEQGQITIMGMIQGTSRITAEYALLTEDISISDSIDVNVIEKVDAPSEIEITPPHGKINYYYLREGFDELFTCRIFGVDNPKWNIEVNPNGNTSANYTATIDDNLGTFKIKNDNMSKPNLIVNIVEETSGKTAEYQIKLAGLF